MFSDQQIETYRRDGYLVIPRLIQGERLAQLRALTDRIVVAPALLDTLAPLVGLLLRGQGTAA